MTRRKCTTIRGSHINYKIQLTLYAVCLCEVYNLVVKMNFALNCYADEQVCVTVLIIDLAATG